MSKEIRLVEVGPRDGLQNEKQPVALEDKLTYIKNLLDSGVTDLEVTSFVRADRIPQMQDAAELYEKVLALKKDHHRFICLVPNQKGMENALNAKVSEMAFFTATSNTFNKKNINCNVDESLERLKPLFEEARKKKIWKRAYISTAFGCPYEGMTSEKKLIEMVEWFLSEGADEISIGDTIGVAAPYQVESLCRKLKKSVGLEKIALHFHDTLGMALVNIMTGIHEGVQIFDGSSGGLGGCPYAKGATGNVASEDILYLLHCLKKESKIDVRKMAKASAFILGKVNKQTPSKFLTQFFVKNGLSS